MSTWKWSERDETATDQLGYQARMVRIDVTLYGLSDNHFFVCF